MRRLIALAVAALALSACTPNLVGIPAGGAGDPTRPSAAVKNVTFFYQDQPASSAQRIGHPRDIVYGAHNNDVTPGSADQVAFAHSVGSLAYRYVQFTWFPAAGPWNGTSDAQRQGMSFCNLTDANDGDGIQHPGVEWDYADANERAFVDAMLSWTARIKALGYDGVFVDVGGRSTAGPGSSWVSSCTTQAVTPGARQRDAWYHLLALVKAQGLHVAANLGNQNGGSPAIDWVLHEYAAHPLENYCTDAVGGRPTFEQSVAVLAREPANVVEMAKARCPLSDPHRRQQEEYVWALAKLSANPVALNAGTDFCGVAPGTTDCNRTGLNGELTDLALGAPIDAGPICLARDAQGCMWTRRFTLGAVVVSAVGAPNRTATLALGVGGCRRVSALDGNNQAGGSCVTSIPVATGVRASHVYLYH